jgi:hypothetical protein
MEIVILLGIASVIGVLMAISVAQANRLARINETWEILERTRLALFNATNSPPAFNQTIGANAGQLTELVVDIGTTGTNSCGGNFKNPEKNKWVAPFGGFVVEPTGLPTPIGIGNNTLVRSPAAGGGGTGTLAIVIPNVDIEDATLLDDVYDGSGGQAAGVVQWTAPAGGLTTLSYLITIDGNC